MTEVFIYDSVRTPRGKGKDLGALRATRAITLISAILKAILERNNLNSIYVDDVILGCVTPVGEQGGDIARAAALHAGLAETVSGVTLNRFCASGLEAINQAAAYIMSNMQDLILAGGVESMSRVPMGSDGGAWMMDPQVTDQTSFVPQGISADLIATLAGYSRAQVDQFALTSQRRAALASKERRFDRSIIPIKDINGNMILCQDEHMRPETTLENLASLAPSFQKLGENYGFDSVAIQKYPTVTQINHVHHAGNSSGIVDGAAIMLLGNREIGKQLGLIPRAKIRSFGVVATDPTIMLNGPVPSARKALKKGKMSIRDIDLFEINEAFAAVALQYIEQLDLSPEIVNVNGGAIAFGHPLGATGAMILGTLLDELERQDLSLGLASLCVGGGMGISTIIERV